MNFPVSRRAWLGRAGSGVLTAVALSRLPGARAVEPFPRTGAARMKLSLAAYSFREFFKDSNHKRDKEPEAGKAIDMFDFVNYCADHGCDAAELTSYYFPASTDKEYLLKLKRHAYLKGVTISGSAVGNTFTHPAGAARDKEMATVKKWIDYCQILGAPHLRVFAGATPKGMADEQAVKNCIEALGEACEYTKDRGVFLGIENHGGIVAESGPLLEIIKSVDSPWLGVNLDTANFHTVDPYADFAKCAPFAVNVQLKTETQAKGKPKERSDLKRFIEILREAKYQGYVALEFEEKADPWKAIPGVLDEMRALMRS
jgi:sugar phosphate isomerase/epimerase